jgi:hypothetical protein
MLTLTNTLVFNIDKAKKNYYNSSLYDHYIDSGVAYVIMKTIFLSLIFLLICTGCSVKYEHVTLDKNNTIQVKEIHEETVLNVETLAEMIQALSSEINPQEAQNLAHQSIYYAMHLANEYDLVAPPSFQNYLVNQKQRDRGLCYHWAKDILAYLKKEEYPTLGIYEVVSNKGEYFFEHHAISITAKGRPFHEGILLDAWRNSGRLFFTRIKEDKEYRWSEKRRVQ